MAMRRIFYIVIGAILLLVIILVVIYTIIYPTQTQVPISKKEIFYGDGHVEEDTGNSKDEKTFPGDQKALGETKFIKDEIHYNDSISALIREVQNENSVILLNKDKEIVIEKAESEYATNYENINNVLKFTDLEFSPNGRFLKYTAYGWEWAGDRIYDLMKNEIVYSEDGAFLMSFTPDEKYLITCANNQLAGYRFAKVYSLPEVSVEYDLFREKEKDLYPDELACELNIEKQTVKYTLSVYIYSPTGLVKDTKRVIEYNWGSDVAVVILEK